MQLPGVSHREGEQTLHDASQFLELIVEYTERLAIFLRASRFGEQQLCLAMKNGERSAQLVRSIRHKLT